MSLKIIGQLAEIYIPAFQSQGNGSAITETVALDSYRQATDTKNDDKRSTLPWWITGLAGLASSIFLSDLHQASSMNAEEITDQADRAFLNGTVDLQYKRYETASTEFQKAYDLYSSVDSSFGRLKSLLALGKTQFLRNDGKAAKDTFNDVNEILRTVNEKTWERITELLDNGRHADALRVFNSAERFYQEATRLTADYATFQGVNEFGLSRNVDRGTHELLKSYTSSRNTFTTAITAEINSSNLFGRLDYKKSAESLGTAIEGYVDLEMYDQAVRCCRAQGEVWTMIRDHAAAAESYGKAFGYLETIERREHAKKNKYDIPKADLLAEIASSLLRVGLRDQAEINFDHALALYRTKYLRYGTKDSPLRKSKIADMYYQKAGLYLGVGKLFGWIRSGVAVEEGLKFVPEHEGLLDAASRRVFSKQWLLDLIPPYLKPARSAAMQYTRRAKALLKEIAAPLKVAKEFARSARAWIRADEIENALRMYGKRIEALQSHGNSKLLADAYLEIGTEALKYNEYKVAQRAYLEGAKELSAAGLHNDALQLLTLSLKYPVDPDIELEARNRLDTLDGERGRMATIEVAGTPSTSEGRASIKVAGKEHPDKIDRPIQRSGFEHLRESRKIKDLYKRVISSGSPEITEQFLSALRKELNHSNLTANDIAMALDGRNFDLQQQLLRVIGRRELNRGWEVVRDKLLEVDKSKKTGRADRTDRLERYKRP